MIGLLATTPLMAEICLRRTLEATRNFMYLMVLRVFVIKTPAGAFKP
jgi:hypothetical protein